MGRHLAKASRNMLTPNLNIIKIDENYIKREIIKRWIYNIYCFQLTLTRTIEVKRQSRGLQSARENSDSYMQGKYPSETKIK